MKINVSGKIFNECYLPFLKDTTPLQIFFGGAGSGKTKFVSDRAVLDVLKGGRNYLVCRKVGRYLRQSVFLEIQKSIERFKAGSLFSINKTDMTITCANGYGFIFFGLDDPSKLNSLTVKKGAITDLWIEETFECTQDDYETVYWRMRGGDDNIKKRVHWTFNPINQNHWIKKEYFPSGFSNDDRCYRDDKCIILRTTYRDNRYLTPDDRERYESMRERNPRKYAIYGLGHWGVLGNLVLENWRSADLSAISNQFDRYKNGLDFGFNPDPAAYVRTAKLRNEIFVFNEAGGHSLSNRDLANLIRPLVRNEVVYCDSAEPKSIEELRQEGISARPARKGRDSLKHGIQWLQNHTIVIDKSCQNTINEIESWCYAKDRHGNQLPTPEDGGDHFMSALIYAWSHDRTKTGFIEGGLYG